MDGYRKDFHASKITEATLMALAEGGEAIIIDKDIVTHFIAVGQNGAIQKHISFKGCPTVVVPELIEALNIAEDPTTINATAFKVHV